MLISEELKEKIRGEVTAYLKENVEHFKERSSIAWDRIDHYRAPLSNIAPDLHSEIEEKAMEWFWENFETEDFLC